MFPIYLRSKARANTATTPRLLASLPYTLVVEPHEAEVYREAFPQSSLLILPESHRGPAYVSNYVLRHVREGGNGWYWLIDDDIQGFFTVENERCVRATAAILLEMEKELVRRHDVALAGVEYRQVAWCAKNEYVWNGYCEGVVCVHAKRTGNITYRPGTKEDRDFALQVIFSGYKTMRFERFAFSSPTDGSNKGGLHERYEQGEHVIWAQRMVDTWGPEICTLVTKKNGKPDVKIRWKEAVKQAQQQVGA